ncbi:large ribosomal subunit protein bL34m [Pseudopipra pipra]|uniref:large ribosomal subunit protein bL34m n=1 Tax=Pseudopipra pipra TaxID=415032 RepID=UPI003138D955
MCRGGDQAAVGPLPWKQRGELPGTTTPVSPCGRRRLRLAGRKEPMGSGVVGGRGAMAALGPVWGRRFSLLQRALPCPFPLLPSSPELLPGHPPALCRLPGAPWRFQQLRGKARGNEYQPNNRKRKKTHGWIRRISTPGGIAVILRRMLKGRKSLSH